MAEKSPKHAHNLRTGIFGYLAFGACGVCIPRIIVSWLYYYLSNAAPDIALSCCTKIVHYFILLAAILFAVSLIYMTVVQFSAFLKEMTPYPKWCSIFNVGIGTLFCLIPALPLSGTDFGKVLAICALSIGNLWQFAGLLIMLRKIKM